MSVVAATKYKYKRRKAQLEFLLTIDEPVLGPVYKDADGFSITGITMSILNHGRPASFNDGNITLYSVITFMRDIQQYLPTKLRKSHSACHELWSRKQSLDEFADDTRELLERVADWFDGMRSSILNILSSEYYCEGKNQYLELLKRRYKDQYSEKVEQAVTADVKADTELKICIEDA